MDRDDNSREKDNRLVDILSALTAGLGIWFLDFIDIPQFLRPPLAKAILGASIKAAAFVSPALLLAIWKHRWRIRWCWIVIATLGTVLAAGIDEWIYRRTVTER